MLLFPRALFFFVPACFFRLFFFALVVLAKMCVVFVRITFLRFNGRRGAYFFRDNILLNAEKRVGCFFATVNLG